MKEGHARGRTLSVSDRAKALAVVLREEFDAPFRFYEVSGGEPARVSLSGEPEGPSSAVAVPAEERAVAARVGAEEKPHLVALADGRYQLWLSFRASETSTLVACGAVAPLAKTPQDAAHEQARLGKWLGSVHDRLRFAHESHHRSRQEADQERHGMVAWDVIMGLDHVLRSLKIHKEPAKNRSRILQTAIELLGVQSLVWVPSHADDDVVIEGERLLTSWDCSQLTNLLAHNPNWDRSGYLICNDTGDNSWGIRFPQVGNVLAIPIGEKGATDFLIAINKRRGAPAGPPPAADAPTDPARRASGVQAPFRRTDAALLMPFASLLGLHSRASQRYHQLRELLIGLARSLTAAIDAKDTYTFGHSERVARIAVEIGRELNLREDELSDIYLAGLLHDIGKIGVQDSILGKKGKLTPEETVQIQQHVTIGYRILADLRPIAHLLPGVLYHHERYDGNGYPEGLQGDGIPLLARILAVADGFDAMTTSRPYRTAMPFEKAEEILTDGAGAQWDRRMVDAFFRCRAKVYAIRQRGVGESLCNALEGALRRGDRNPTARTCL